MKFSIILADPCDLWEGVLFQNGYGRDGSNRVHRLEWIKHHGPIPKGMLVLHGCDVLYPATDITYRRCKNINHLYIGTHMDNMKHMIESGRVCKGSSCHNAVVTQSQVARIREEYIPGVIRQIDIANKYGISQVQVSSILRFEDWA